MKSQSLLVYLYNIVLFILRESVCPLLRCGLQASFAGNQGNHRDILPGYHPRHLSPIHLFYR